MKPTTHTTTPTPTPPTTPQRRAPREAHNPPPPKPFPPKGEHIDQFEIFETRRFVSRLLGRGDVGGLMDKIQDVIPEVGAAGGLPRSAAGLAGWRSGGCGPDTTHPLTSHSSRLPCSLLSDSRPNPLTHPSIPTPAIHYPPSLTLSPPIPPLPPAPQDKQPELLETISRGNVTMRVMRDVFDSFLNMGPVSQVGGGPGREGHTALTAPAGAPPAV
jgi:hypothetical protein